MLNPNAKYIGVGVCKSPITGQWLWTQEFSYNPDVKGTIIFDANGGTFESNASSQISISGPEGKTIILSEIEKPTKEGYIFDGWEGLSSVKIQAGTDTLFATWTPISES